MSGTQKRFKKCLIRDRTFHEVDDENRKIKDGQLKLTDIDSVIALKDKAFAAIPVKEFIETCHEKLFWNVSN
jgi:hypothetical protein